MSEIFIRETEYTDAEKLIEYMKKIGNETDKLTFGKEGILISKTEEEKYIQDIKNDPNSVSYIACRNDEIIGNVVLRGLSRRMKHRAELGITILKSHWNRGIGGLLLKKTIEYTKENNIEIINLEVRSDNKSAIHLYEKFGFKKIGIYPAYFKIDDNYIDFDIMYLDLRENY